MTKKHLISIICFSKVYVIFYIFFIQFITRIRLSIKTNALSSIYHQNFQFSSAIIYTLQISINELRNHLKRRVWHMPCDVCDVLAMLCFPPQFTPLGDHYETQYLSNKDLFIYIMNTFSVHIESMRINAQTIKINKGILRYIKLERVTLDIQNDCDVKSHLQGEKPYKIYSCCMSKLNIYE